MANARSRWRTKQKPCRTAPREHNNSGLHASFLAVSQLKAPSCKAFGATLRQERPGFLRFASQKLCSVSTTTDCPALRVSEVAAQEKLCGEGSDRVVNVVEREQRQHQADDAVLTAPQP